MEGHCLKCGAQLESPWSFCPHCGAASARETHVKSVPEEHEKAPVQGAFSGLLFGMLAVPILIIVGTMLCLTGLGAILGIPLIIAAVFAPLLGPMVGFGALKGKCPWCGTWVSSIANAKDFGCQVCSKRIAIKHREFVRAA
jgi:DNA-directed RNA polymerase subunit RPC12/RpoP